MAWETAAHNKDRMMEVYYACMRHMIDTHNFPTFRWIIANTDITSTSVVRRYLDKLVYRKLIEKVPEGSYKFTDSIWMPGHDAPLPTELYDELLDNFVAFSLKIPVGKLILNQLKE